MNSRIEYLRQTMVRFGVDGVVVNPGASLRWLTGLNFHLMERPVVLYLDKDRKPLIILPELELAKLDGLKSNSFALLKLNLQKLSKILTFTLTHFGV